MSPAAPGWTLERRLWGRGAVAGGRPRTVHTPVVARIQSRLRATLAYIWTPRST